MQHHNLRMESFTRRQVLEREQLYSPLQENTNWIEDDDYDANYDYVFVILVAFGAAALVGSAGILIFLGSVLIQWP